MGMRTMLIDSYYTENYGGEISGTPIVVLGRNGLQLLVDKRLRVPINNEYGRVYVNNNVYAYKNILEGPGQ